MRQFVVVGRHKPTEKIPAPEVFRMKIFAPNSVVARSRFWYYLSNLKKVKKANGEIVEVHELFEKKPTAIKNFGMWIRYDSRSGTHNMYKEFRDVTLTGAVEKMYAQMASLHRARKSSVQIVRTAVVAAKDTKRAGTWEYHNANIKFRLPHRVPRSSSKTYRNTFSAVKPTTFF